MNCVMLFPSPSGRGPGRGRARHRLLTSIAPRRIDLPHPQPYSAGEKGDHEAILMQPNYAELHCISSFSFLRGASHPEELVQREQMLGYHALALTDECSVAGTVRAHVAAGDLGFKLIIGA